MKSFILIVLLMSFPISPMQKPKDIILQEQNIEQKFKDGLSVNEVIDELELEQYRREGRTKCSPRVVEKALIGVGSMLATIGSIVVTIIGIFVRK